MIKNGTGYGHIVPRTVGGRIACLAYTLIGIPLVLVTIADMGRFLSGTSFFIQIISLTFYKLQAE